MSDERVTGMQPEVPGIDVCPVLDARGFVVVFDLRIAGRWVGSRRTAKQCEEWLSYLCDARIVATPGTPW